ncbi:Gfo/Idh/MocA family oxidoreductase [Demequina capsici]|uniref:Gfo/Idh/MocA family oxidoreductase n=1 Tax=Demequina capsici TaxID=3075620 RepID=A0AA96FEP4_9MICO|nr:Gfo/Idh/MocA family oxidoreductase [Demequina sp. PMTSA13]WNM27221.1 Gfo/Idh/MocA family oxidoreductase [Demequina sp. PMTSA13]
MITDVEAASAVAVAALRESTPRPLRWAVIGYGFIGRRHVASLDQLPGARVVAVCDVSDARLAEAREAKPGIATYDSVARLLGEASVDAVVVATPNRTHAEIVIAAAHAGKHILCEKPAALDVAELDAMLSAVAESGVRFTVHQQRRLDKDYCTVKAAVESGALGEVYTIQSSLYGYNGRMHDWHVYTNEGGGMLYDWGVHMIDQALDLVDSELVSVWAEVRNVINDEVDDYFKILMCFANDVVVELELGTYFLADRDGWFDRHWYVGGSTGALQADGFDPAGAIVRTTALLENVAHDQDKSAASYGPTRSFGVPRPGLIATEPLPTVEVDHAEFYTDMLDAWRDGRDSRVRAAEVRRVLAVMEAARESSRTRMSIDCSHINKEVLR